jgi:hypothetical protein
MKRRDFIRTAASAAAAIGGIAEFAESRNPAIGRCMREQLTPFGCDMANGNDCAVYAIVRDGELVAFYDARGERADWAPTPFHSIADDDLIVYANDYGPSNFPAPQRDRRHRRRRR